jgi:hypothetical protein
MGSGIQSLFDSFAKFSNLVFTSKTVTTVLQDRKYFNTDLRGITRFGFYAPVSTFSTV